MSPEEQAVILPQSRTEYLVDQLRRLILSGAIPAGQQLVEQNLCSRFNVSKSPVREALRVLATEGIVTLNPYRGARVVAVDSEFADNVYTARLLLEPYAVECTARATDTPRIARAHKVLDRARAAIASNDTVVLGELNRQFHQLMYSGCANSILVEILDSLKQRTALISITAWAKQESYRAEYEEHRGILEAVESADPTAAKERTQKHIERFGMRASSLLQDDEPAHA